MPENAILYVKSEKFEQVEYTMSHHDHWCSAGYRVTKTDYVLGEEDRKAVELLEKANLKFKIVDLGLADALTRFKAKTEGVNETPTLVYMGRKLKGLGQIEEALEKTANATQK
ncbi:MAG: hypothetical protein ACPL1Z_02240 [Candidatus Bathyarchaeales archaeon]|nr:MAG: hypothetical protein C0199_00225 [Candidatus Bathyarchaeota archaeon]